MVFRKMNSDDEIDQGSDIEIGRDRSENTLNLYFCCYFRDNYVQYHIKKKYNYPSAVKGLSLNIFIRGG
jgi:hypothetical protein